MESTIHLEAIMAPLEPLTWTEGTRQSNTCQESPCTSTGQLVSLSMSFSLSLSQCVDLPCQLALSRLLKTDERGWRRAFAAQKDGHECGDDAVGQCRRRQCDGTIFWQQYYPKTNRKSSVRGKASEAKQNKYQTVDSRGRIGDEDGEKSHFACHTHTLPSFEQRTVSLLIKQIARKWFCKGGLFRRGEIYAKSTLFVRLLVSSERDDNKDEAQDYLFVFSTCSLIRDTKLYSC